MLKKISRLKTKEIDLIFKKGKSVFRKNLGVKFLQNNLNINRFVVIVGKKVSKSAVERNRIKRLIKRNILDISFKKQGFDFIIITQKTIKEIDCDKSKKEFLSILKQLKVV